MRVNQRVRVRLPVARNLEGSAVGCLDRHGRDLRPGHERRRDGDLEWEYLEVGLNPTPDKGRRRRLGRKGEM